MVKVDFKPRAAASRRSTRTQKLWKVEIHMCLARGPTSASIRSRISAAALLVKVMARIWPGGRAMGCEQVGDAVGEHASLAGAGARNDEQGRAGVQHGFFLAFIEPGGEGGGVHRIEACGHVRSRGQRGRSPRRSRRLGRRAA